MQINVLEYFLAAHRGWPQKTAVVDGHEAWTFERLSRRATSIAGEIVSRTTSTKAPIAVYLPKINDVVASFLAVLFSGNFYAPLDIKSPIARTSAILKRLDPVLILTTRRLGMELVGGRIDPRRLLVLDESFIDAVEAPERWLSLVDTDPVYVMHTSGSTGNPKGVVVTHRSVIDFIDRAIDCFKIDDRSVVGNQAPLMFDISTFDLYMCFACGATLHLIPDELFFFPLKLMEYLEHKLVNVIFWVPSIMIDVASKGILDRVPRLRLDKVLFCGEVMPAKSLNIWRARFPSALFANLYGPTETTVSSTYYIVDRQLGDCELVPIGRPFRNTDVLKLNEQNLPCESGEKGELCVRGSSLALGYWNEPVQTAAVFVQNSLNRYHPDLIYRTGDLVYRNHRGEIIFVERKDSQIKHMGYRIELGDIEHFALQVPGIRNACVLYDCEAREIVLVYEADADIDPGLIRSDLGRNLSMYMWPTIFRRVSALPHTATGKIDRRKLAEKYGAPL